MAFLSATAIHQKEVILLTLKLCLFCCKPTGQGVQTSTPNLKVQPNGFSQGRRQRTTTGSGRGPPQAHTPALPPLHGSTKPAKEEQTTGSGRGPPLFFFCLQVSWRGGEQRCSKQTAHTHTLRTTELTMSILGLDLARFPGPEAPRFLAVSGIDPIAISWGGEKPGPSGLIPYRTSMLHGPNHLSPAKNS